MKTIKNGVLISLFFSAIIACTNSKQITEGRDSLAMQADTSKGVRAYADISATKSDTIGNGKAEFLTNDYGSVELNLTVNFPKMANKSVAVHLHEHGDCSDFGKGAHGHWNPTGEAHGKWGSEAFHSGDIGNVELNAEGTGSITISSTRWTIGGDDKTNILNRAVIVHSGVDDYKTQPTGNAGSRIGCGVIIAKP